MCSVLDLSKQSYSTLGDDKQTLHERECSSSSPGREIPKAEFSLPANPSTFCYLFFYDDLIESQDIYPKDSLSVHAASSFLSFSTTTSTLNTFQARAAIRNDTDPGW